MTKRKQLLYVSMNLGFLGWALLKYIVGARLTLVALTAVIAGAVGNAVLWLAFNTERGRVDSTIPHRTTESRTTVRWPAKYLWVGVALFFIGMVLFSYGVSTLLNVAGSTDFSSLLGGGAALLYGAYMAAHSRPPNESIGT